MHQQDTTTAPQIIPITDIHVAPGHNPRKNFKQADFDRLVESIRENDLLTPILVRPNPIGDGYELVAGERRLRALKQLQRDTVPALIRAMDDVEARRAALIENIDRANLSVAEECIASRAHVDAYDGDHDAAARALGWGVQKLKHRLRLLHCAGDVMNALVNEQITQAHAELLATLPADSQLKALPRILEKGLSVTDLKEQLNGFAIPLEQACFDRQAAGCNTCEFNSSIQRSLFETHISDSRCTNRPCCQAKSVEALEAKRMALREDFGTVAFLTEKVPGAAVPLVIHGESGVGVAQFAKCRECAFRGAVIDDRLGTTTGRVDQPLCFNRPCNTGMVASHQESLNPASQDDGDGDANDAPTASGAKAPSKPVSNAAPKSAKGKAKKAAAKATPAAVSDQHAAILRRALSARIQSDPTIVLGFALYGLIRTVAEETGRDGVDAVAKALDVAVPKGKAPFPSHTLLVAALAQCEKPALQQGIVAAAGLLCDRNPNDTVYHTKLNRRALVASLVEQAQIDLVPYVRIDEEFLAAHTKGAIEQIMEESGFSEWLKAEQDGEKRLRTLLAAGKTELVKGVLAANFPGFATYVPSALADQIAAWRKAA